MLSCCSKSLNPTNCFDFERLATATAAATTTTTGYVFIVEEKIQNF